MNVFNNAKWIWLNVNQAKDQYAEFNGKFSLLDKENVKLKYSGTNIITTDMKKGTKLGKIEVIYEDNVLDTIDMTYNQKKFVWNPHSSQYECCFDKKHEITHKYEKKCRI